MLKPPFLAARRPHLRRLLVAAALAPLLAWAPPARSADPAAESFLHGIYESYFGQEAQGVDFFSEEGARRYFTPALADLVIKDTTESQAADEVGRLDFDPFVEGQDWALADVDIATEDAGQDRETATAKFRNFDQDLTVRYDLVKTQAGWRIDDVHWADQPDSLRQILSQPAE